MPMWNLTLEKVEELKKQLKDKTTELENLKVGKEFWSNSTVQTRFGRAFLYWIVHILQYCIKFKKQIEI